VAASKPSTPRRSGCSASPGSFGIGRQVQGRRKDGSIFPVHLSVGHITIEGEQKFTGILHDLTPRLRLEEQLREQATLAKLGEMAAVIAHEVKNPLAGIRGVMQVFASRTSADGLPPQVLKEIIARIDALDQMMKDLLLFARPPKPQRVRTEILPLLETTAGLLSQDPSWRQLKIEIVGTTPPVSADPDMLRIVFQNLMLNSAHAMQGTGAAHRRRNRRLDLSDCVRGHGHRHSRRDPGQGLHALLHHQVPGVGPGPADHEAAGRGSRRARHH
jgi:signal transduction histidine kinase